MLLRTHPLFVTEDLSEASAGALRLGLDVKLRSLDNKERFRCTVNRVTLGATELAYWCQEGRVAIRGEVATDSFLLCVSRSGKAEFRCQDREFTLEPDNPLLMLRDSFECRSSSATEMMLVRISCKSMRGVLHKLLQRQPYRELVFHPEQEASDPQRISLLQRYLDFLYEEADRVDPLLLVSPLALDQAEKFLATLLLETLPNSYSTELQHPGGSPTPWYLKAADDVIREQLADTTSTGKLAAAVGVSPKALRRIFVETKGITPTRYLRKLRFQRVRSDLQNARPNETVTDIALKWGFNHLGRFSVEYRREFSESPSHTLRASYAGAAAA
jgi:AraC-like DNA-binding protein